jgi:hypothetical protein
VNAIPASLGIYGVPDAARITGVHPRQIHGWLQGYSQRQRKTAAPPILHRQHEIRDGDLALGFLDLLEVAFLGRIVQAAERQGRTLSWKALRAAAGPRRGPTSTRCCTLWRRRDGRIERFCNGCGTPTEDRGAKKRLCQWRDSLQSKIVADAAVIGQTGGLQSH